MVGREIFKGKDSFCPIAIGIKGQLYLIPVH